MPKKLSPQSTVVAVKDQVSADLAGEAAILHLKKGVYYGLDPVGTRVWDLVRTPRTISQIRDLLVTEYEIRPQRCEADLLGLLDQLRAEGLVEIKE